MTSETKDETQAQEALDYERYVAARDVATTVSADQSKIIDQTILAFGGGGLGITLTFLHDFVTVPVTPILLYVGDGLLLLSIMVVLISLHTSQKSISDHVNELDNAARNDFGDEHTQFMKAPYINPWAKHTANLNMAATVFVLAGMLSVALFVFQNSTGKESQSVTKDLEKKVTRPGVTDAKKGAVLQAPTVPPKQAAPPQKSQPIQTPLKK